MHTSSSARASLRLIFMASPRLGTEEDADRDSWDGRQEVDSRTRMELGFKTLLSLRRFDLVSPVISCRVVNRSTNVVNFSTRDLGNTFFTESPLRSSSSSFVSGASDIATLPWRLLLRHRSHRLSRVQALQHVARDPLLPFAMQ